MPGTDQRERKSARDRGRAAADAEELCRLCNDQFRLREQCEAGRDDRVDDNELEALAAFRFARAAAGADHQHLGGGAAFGIGQVGIDHERAAQRHREHDAEDAAGHRDPGSEQIGEALPPADHDEAGEHENDRRQRARRRRDRLYDVVFEDRRARQIAQDRHRNDRGRDRRCEGKADLQPEIHVRRGEQQRDEPAEQDAANGEFGDGRRAVGPGRGAVAMDRGTRRQGEVSRGSARRMADRQWWASARHKLALSRQRTLLSARRRP